MRNRGQQARFLQHIVQQVMGVIDHQHRKLVGLQQTPGDLGADGAAGAGPGAAELEP